MTSSPASPTRLVIFDLDGVLVDVQAAENGAIAELAAGMGVPLTQAAADDMFSGRRLGDCIAMVEDLAGIPAPDDAVERVRSACERLIGPTIEPIDGVPEALAALSLPKCVASNSPAHLIAARVRAAGIADHFTALYSAYDAGRWKPDPTLFLWAAREQGVPASEAVVVEDSRVGVEAAVAAGMRVLQFRGGTLPAPPMPTAVVFDSMRSLPDLIHDTMEVAR